MITIGRMLECWPEYGRELCCRRDGDGWVYEASVSNFPGPLEPIVRWLHVRRWKSEPTEAQVARARASAMRRYFRTCIHCGQPCNRGCMHDKDTCISCAADVYGVIY